MEFLQLQNLSHMTPTLSVPASILFALLRINSYLCARQHRTTLGHNTDARVFGSVYTKPPTLLR